MLLRAYAVLALITLGLLPLTGCIHDQAFSKAETALKDKDWDVAVAEYSHALAEHPQDAEIKLKLNMAKTFAARLHYEKAKKLQQKKDLQGAVTELLLATQLDPENTEADDVLMQVQ